MLPRPCPGWSAFQICAPWPPLRGVAMLRRQFSTGRGRSDRRQQISSGPHGSVRDQQSSGVSIADAAPVRAPETQEAEMSQLVIKTDGDVVPIVETGAAVQQSAVDQRGVFCPVSAVEPSRNQRGMVTAEWAVGIIAAAGLAGVLIAVLTSGPVESALLKVILHFIEAVADKF